MDLVPYSFTINYPQQVPALITRPGRVQGVYITLHADVVEDVAAKFARWFVGRDEVEIVDVGTSDKVGLGFIMVEWSECDVDRLFLAMLQDEEFVGDYTLYGRRLEGTDGR